MKWIYSITAVGLSLCALYYTFENVPFLDIWRYSLSIDYTWVLLSIGINFASFLIRAYRWRVIVYEFYPLKFSMAYHLTSIAFMMNSMLPGRLGELARPVILNKKMNVPIAAGLTTVVTERLFDIIVLCLLYLAVVMFVNIDPNYQMTFGTYTLSHELLTSLAIHAFWVFLIFLFCIICINVNSIRSLMKRILKKVPHIIFFAGPRAQEFIERKCIQPIIVLIDHISGVFSFFKRPAVIIHCFVLSVMIWILIAVSIYVMTFGCKNVNINLFEMCAVLVIICFFISLPSVPGSWGLWEAGGIFALTIFGVGKQEATAFIIVNHATSLFPIIVAGLISIMITGISIRSSRTFPEKE
jgi:hypothetical protein